MKKDGHQLLPGDDRREGQQTTDPSQIKAETTDPSQATAETTDPSQIKAETTDPSHIEAETTDPSPIKAETTSPSQATASTVGTSPTVPGIDLPAEPAGGVVCNGDEEDTSQHRGRLLDAS